jgi:hypothetical protein
MTDSEDSELLIGIGFQVVNEGWPKNLRANGSSEFQVMEQSRAPLPSHLSSSAVFM